MPIAFGLNANQIGKGIRQSISYKKANEYKYGDIARSIELYGDGKAFGNIHHVLVIIQYDSYNRLLELSRSDKKDGNIINIKDIKKTNWNDLFSHLKNPKRWGGTEYVNCYDSVINKVIDDYNGKEYIAYLPFGITRNCRTFVNDIFRACDSDKRTDKNGFGDYIGVD